MPYAHNGRISTDPIDGGLEISDEQYQQALDGMLNGMVVSIEGGFSVAMPPAPSLPEPPEPIPPSPTTIFSARDYLRRFTMAEYAAARSGPVEVQWALDNLIGAQFVDIHDPDVAAGLDAMVQVGIITPERRTELLTPQAAE